jgi:hypothetical protein
MRIFSSHPDNHPLIETINEFIEDNSMALVLVITDKAYLLVEHHRYLKPAEQAKRLYLGKVVKTEPGSYYFSEVMNVIPYEVKPAKVIAPKRKR